MTEIGKNISDASRAQRNEVKGVAPQEQAFPLDFTSIASILKRGRWTVLTVTFGGFLLATIAAALLPTKYSSKASFLPPNSSSGSSAMALAGQLSSLGASSLLGNVKNSGDLYAGILRSRSIANELIKRFDLKEVYGVKRESDAVKSLASNTEIEVGTKDSIVTITVNDKSPERARDLAAGYLDALREVNGRLALTESSQRRLFMEQQLAKEKSDLADAEVELKKTEEQTGLIAPVGQTALQLQTMAATKSQIAILQVQMAALRQSSTSQNPGVIRLQSEIEDLMGQLALLQNGTGKSVVGAIPASQVPELQLEYIRKERDVKYHEALFEMLAKQFEAARMDEAHDAALLQVLDSASYPDVKSSPHRTLIAGCGLLLGCLIGCVWIIGREYVQSAASLLASPEALANGELQ